MKHRISSKFYHPVVIPVLLEFFSHERLNAKAGYQRLCSRFAKGMGRTATDERGSAGGKAMIYYHKQDAAGRKYEVDLGKDPVIQRWLGEVATGAARPETTVTFVDTFPYDEIRFWQCDRCGGQVPRTVLWGIQICGYCGGEGRERSWVKPEVRKKLLEARIEEFLD